jgi:hypothetical protein
MAYIANFDASNKADFVVEFSATDADTGDDIDFTGFDIAFKVADDCATVIEATTANGLITLPTSTVLQLTIPASRMAALWAQDVPDRCGIRIQRRDHPTPRGKFCGL